MEKKSGDGKLFIVFIVDFVLGATQVVISIMSAEYFDGCFVHIALRYSTVIMVLLRATAVPAGTAESAY